MIRLADHAHDVVARRRRRHGHRAGRRQPRRAAARDRAPRLVRAGHAGHPLRHRRRGDRQRHPRQEPPRRRLVRRPASRACRCSSPSGERRRARRRERRRGAELFWATVGGMGLTGIDRRRHDPADPDRDQPPRRRHRSRCPTSTRCWRRWRRATEWFRYSVAWIDPMARGRHLGRGVLTRADHATVDHGRAAAGRRPARLRPPPAHRRAADRAGAGRHQPHDDQGVQRAVVPQGAAPPGRPDHVDRRLLPPARHGRVVEPAVRPRRLRAVPAAAAVRRRRSRCAQAHGALRGVRRAELPRRAQALRGGQPGAAQLPGAGVDADRRRPGGDARPAAAVRTASTSWCSTPVVATTWPRTAT